MALGFFWVFLVKVEPFYRPHHSEGLPIFIAKARSNVKRKMHEENVGLTITVYWESQGL